MKDMKNISYITFLLLTIMLIAFGCKKDELTKPVKVNFLATLKSGSQTQNFISFIKGTFTLSKITFEGNREEGGDVSFETKPGFDFGFIQFDTINSGTLITHFDIPQGVYSLMKWGIVFSAIDSSTYEFETESAGLIIEGVYTSQEGLNVPVYIIINSFEGIEVQATNPLGFGKITLVDEKTYSATLQIDMNYVISSIARESFENAEREEEDTSFIEISSGSNESLYQLILFRIQNSAKIVVE